MTKILIVYTRLYTSCLTAALRGIARNPWTLLLPIGLAVTFNLVVLPLVGSLGVLGGIALALAFDALYSCYLYFTGEVVASSRVTLRELKASFGAYFWSLMNLFFVLWVVDLLLGLLVRGSPNGALIANAVWLVLLILLNPAPEIIYVRRTHNGLETVQASIRFLQEQWIEWFVPNLLLLLGAYLLVTRVLSRLPPGLTLLALLVAGALFHVAMVFRGHLFRALDGSSHRQRMFRYRNAG
ncbi:MAG: hypothetical protein IRZ16_04700 [Myxococcaceae bacterium]|nr:hypothetical protein [Myxococcaceae bacterium]